MQYLDKLDLILNEGITVSTRKYVNSHGVEPNSFQAKKKFGEASSSTPWMFQIGKEEKTFNGVYREALNQAKAYAKEKGVYNIEVLP
jgi:hypothetical protein